MYDSTYPGINQHATSSGEFEGYCVEYHFIGTCTVQSVPTTHLTLANSRMRMGRLHGYALFSIHTAFTPKVQCCTTTGPDRSLETNVCRDRPWNYCAMRCFSSWMIQLRSARSEKMMHSVKVLRCGYLAQARGETKPSDQMCCDYNMS